MNKQSISQLGNETLLQRSKTVFLCSHEVPSEIFEHMRQWARTLSADGCVLCGCISGIERYMLKLLLKKKIPVILTLAETLPTNVEEISSKLSDIKMSDAMGEGRLLIVSVNPDQEDKTATGYNAGYRNRWMLSVAEHIVIGYLLPYGRLAGQLIGFKNVTYLMKAEHTEPPTAKERENMGWAIYHYLRDKGMELSSMEFRSLLNDYLKLESPRPSLLHSVMLQLVLNKKDKLEGFRFPAFLRLWGIHNFRTEDYNAIIYKEKEHPALIQQVMEALKKEGETPLLNEMETALNSNH